jgi:hypothetical protein
MYHECKSHWLLLINLGYELRLTAGVQTATIQLGSDEFELSKPAPSWPRRSCDAERHF